MGAADDAGYIDLHCHPLPAVDDGVRTLAESQQLLAGLAALGYARVVATPHIRDVMFPNRRSSLQPAFARLLAELPLAELPQLDLAAEHFVDDTLMQTLRAGEALPYPGGQAILIELPPERPPIGLANWLFQLRLLGLRPVLAHPERYRYCWGDTKALSEMCRLGAQPLLDLMALEGHYGRQPRRAAEKFLECELYRAACSDAHRPADVETVAAAIERLHELVGSAASQRLLSEQPQHILAPARVGDEKASA